MKNYKKSEDQIESSLWNWKTESFWEATVRSSSSSATATPLKAETFRHWMERPTPLLPAVTALIDLQPYKDPGKGNLAEDKKKKEREERNREHEPNRKKRQKREGKVKGQHREEYWLCHCFRPCRQRKTQNQNKFTAGRPLHHLLGFKSCWENKRKTQTSEHRRKIKGSSRRESISAASIFSLQKQVRPFLHFAFFKFARALGEGN